LSKVIGVIGGMGPEATADFFVKLIRRTPARTDAEHRRVLIDSNPRIPDRTAFITGAGPSPAPALVATAQGLERAGAQLLTMPCITAHHFIDDIRAAVDVPVLSAVELTARHLDARFEPDAPIAILSTAGTLRMKLFQNAMPGRTFVTPTDAEQQTVVTDAIYGDAGVKAVGVDAGTVARVMDYVTTLAERGAQAVIAGCTEFSVLFAGVETCVPLVDPMWLLAEEAIRLS